jgi:DNA-binding beta-propeller fold protein YncE
MSWALGLAAAAALATSPVAGGGRLLVVTKQSHALAIVDPGSLKVVATAPVGEDPHEVVVGPDHRTAFVSNFGEGTLHTIQRIDLVQAKALAPVDTNPLAGIHGLAVSGDQLWFTAVASKAIAALDPATGRQVAVLGTGEDNSHMLWVAPGGARILVTNAGSGTLSIFDRTTHAPSTVAGAPMPPARYTHADWRHSRVPTGPGAEGFAVSPDGREAWVGDARGMVTIVDLTREIVTGRFDGGAPGANRLAFTPDGLRVLMTTHGGRDLLVFDARARRILARVPIEQRGASGIQIQPDGTRAFIACPRDHYVAVVDLANLTMAGRIDAGREPDGLAWWQP